MIALMSLKLSLISRDLSKNQKLHDAHVGRIQAEPDQHMLGEYVSMFLMLQKLKLLLSNQSLPSFMVIKV